MSLVVLPGGSWFDTSDPSSSPELCGEFYGVGFPCQFPKGHIGEHGHPKYDRQEPADPAECAELHR